MSGMISEVSDLFCDIFLILKYVIDALENKVYSTICLSILSIFVSSSCS